jgi:hypothetical protein
MLTLGAFGGAAWRRVRCRGPPQFLVPLAVSLCMAKCKDKENKKFAR